MIKIFMKTIPLQLLIILFASTVVFSQDKILRIAKFENYFDSVDLELLSGTYSLPIIYNEKLIDMGGMAFDIEGRTEISFDPSNAKGTILTKALKDEIKFKIESSENEYKITCQQAKSMNDTFRGQIICLNDTTLRILYFDKTSQLQMVEYIK